MTDILQTFIFHIFQQNYTRHIRVKPSEAYYYFEDNFSKFENFQKMFFQS